MAKTVKKCTVGAKHKWEWVKDTTVKSVSMGLNGTSARISRRGVFKCACGERKLGEARS